MSTIQILQGDCRDVMRRLPAESVHCVVTSPPYWGLRDYGLPDGIWGGVPDCSHQWEGHLQPSANGSINVEMKGETLSSASATRKPKHSAFCSVCSVCGAWRGQLGLEPSPELFISHMVDVFREVWRVLRPDGTLWLNIGDSYSGSGKGGNPGHSRYNKQQRNAGSLSVRGQKREPPGCKPKDLIGIPWLLAFALRSDGWYLRSDIVWSKPNPMPESVSDRPTKSHEYIFLLSKGPRYFYDAEAITEAVSPNTHARLAQDVAAQVGSDRANGRRKSNGSMKAVGRKLVEAGRGIKANTDFHSATALHVTRRNKRSVWEVTTQSFKEAHFATFPPKLIEPCILAGCPITGTVLDPFGGSGTVGEVCSKLGRDAVLIELNPDYIEIAQRRVANAPLSLFTPDARAQTNHNPEAVNE